MTIHNFAAIDADCLLEESNGRGNVESARGIWGNDCSVLICENTKGRRTLLTSCGPRGLAEVRAGDTVSVWHTQTGRTSKLGKALGVVRPNMNLKDDKQAARLWVLK